MFPSDVLGCLTKIPFYRIERFASGYNVRSSLSEVMASKCKISQLVSKQNYYLNVF